jgi:hypothetical protein
MMPTSMAAVSAASSLPLASDPLSPATKAYLQRRVGDASAPLIPQQLRIKLYQCLADGISVQALCQDLLQAARGGFSLAAVFECPPPAPEQGFGAALHQHLQQMQHLEPRISAAGIEPGTIDEEDLALRLRVLGQDFLLIAMHADAERLSRVMPCPVLVFHPLQGQVLC